MENKKKAKVDYAAIIREFEMYGRGRSLKQFCDDSSYFILMCFIKRLRESILIRRMGRMPAKCLKVHGIR